MLSGIPSLARRQVVYDSRLSTETDVATRFEVPGAPAVAVDMVLHVLQLLNTRQITALLNQRQSHVGRDPWAQAVRDNHLRMFMTLRKPDEEAVSDCLRAVHDRFFPTSPRLLVGGLLTAKTLAWAVTEGSPHEFTRRRGYGDVTRERLALKAFIQSNPTASHLSPGEVETLVDDIIDSARAAGLALAATLRGRLYTTP